MLPVESAVSDLSSGYYQNVEDTEMPTPLPVVSVYMKHGIPSRVGSHLQDVYVYM